MEIDFKPLFVGAVLSLVIAMYSAYAGLKIGGVYWPGITAALLAMAVLPLFGKPTRKQINIAQAVASSGGLLAAGVIFTIPALWMLGATVSVFTITVVALCGGTLGVLFSYILRERLIVKERLPCPDGAAAARVIEAGDAGGGRTRSLLASFSLGGAVALVRDFFHLTSFSAIPYAGGFLIGLKFTGIWFLGALLSTVLREKAGITAGSAASIGIGVVIGSSLVYFLHSFAAYGSEIARSRFRMPEGVIAVLVLMTVSLSYFTGMDAPTTFIAIIGAFGVSYVAARVTGELNLDPMEIYAIAILLVVRLVLSPALGSAVLLAAVLSIAAGMAGDMMQDLKTAHMLGTPAKELFWAQLVGVIIPSLAIGTIMVSLNATHQIGGPEMPAPQATALASLLSAPIENYLLYGLAAGVALTAISIWLNQGVVGVAFGIGMYVPWGLSFALFVGGLIRSGAEHFRLFEKGQLASSGIIGGEGLVGVILSLLQFGGLIK